MVVTTHITLHPAVAYYLGRIDHFLGDLDAADVWYAESMEIAERLGSPLLVAYSEAAWAALLADRDTGDDRERARTMAESALTAATVGGWGYIEADARAVLEHLG